VAESVTAGDDTLVPFLAGETLNWRIKE